MNQLKQQVYALYQIAFAITLAPFILMAYMLQSIFLWLPSSLQLALSRAVLVPLFVFFGVSGAHAAVPADVTTAISTAVTDVGTFGAAILGVIVAIMAFKWLRRAL